MVTQAQADDPVDRASARSRYTRGHMRASRRAIRRPEASNRRAFLAALAALAAITAARASVPTIAPGQELTLRLPAGDPKTTVVAVEYRAGAPGTVTLEARSLDFDSKLKIGRLEPDGRTTPVGEDDDGGAGHNSLMSFDAAAGAVYRFEVRATGEDHGGALLLRLSAGPAPAADAARDRQADLDYLAAAADRAKEIGDRFREARVSYSHASLLFGAGDYRGAVPLLERSLSAYEIARGPESPEVINALTSLG